MKGIKNSLIALGGMSLIIGAIAFVTPRSTQGQGGSRGPTDVNVVNTPNVNVGNTPSVNVANNPTVNFATGASVGINPSSNTVQLDNTTTNPLPTVDVNDGRQPFQATASSAVGDVRAGFIRDSSLGKPYSMFRFPAIW